MEVAHTKDFVLSSLEHGYYTFPLREAENAIGTGEMTQQALNSLSRSTAAEASCLAYDRIRSSFTRCILYYVMWRASGTTR